MVETLQWERWREEISRSRSATELRRRLMLRAEQLGIQLMRLQHEHAIRSSSSRASRHDEWALLGVDVRTTTMESSGASRFGADQKLVLVRADDPPLRQRFTVAHEIGHYFLSQAGISSTDVSHAQEEALCDEFASKLLLPPTELSRELRRNEGQLTITDLLALCKGFRVSFQPMLIALRDLLPESSPIFLAASHRGHRFRPDVLDFRVDASAHPKSFYIAKDQRLSSMGLGDVTQWALSSPEPTRGQGRADALRLKLWDRTKHLSGKASGTASWEAAKLRSSGVLIVQLAPLELNLAWSTSRESKTKKTGDLDE